MMIFSNAQKRSDYESHLSGQFIIMITHFAKLYAFPKSQNKDHWQEEIYAFLHTAPLLKSSKKYPRFEWIVNKTIGEYRNRLPLFENEMKDVIDLYPKECKRSNMSNVEFFKMVEIYMNWLAKRLSTDGQVSRDEVQEKLSKIFKEETTEVKKTEQDNK